MSKVKKVQVGRFILEEYSYGVRVIDNGEFVGRIDNVKAKDLSEEEIEELMYGDLDENENVKWWNGSDFK